jgi:alkylhydroperoxidase family enzyme
MSRIVYKKVAPAVYQAMRSLEQCVKDSALELPLLELVRTRASQVNGCAFCLDMHSRMPSLPAKRRSASLDFQPGATRPSRQIVSAPRSRGPRR